MTPIDSLLASHVDRIGVPPTEHEHVYQAKRARLGKAVARGELTGANLTPQLAWYLPSDVVDRLHRDSMREPPPSVRRFGIPLGPGMVDAVDRDHLRDTKPLVRVQSWWDAWRDPAKDQAKPAIVLIGGTGNGKTVAGAWLCRQAGKRARYRKSADLCSVHGSRWSEHTAEWREAVAAFVLVLDEVGGTLDQARERAMVHDIIDERQGEPTLIISNLDAAGLKSRLDARTIDRLREVAAFAACDGPSMRGGR